MELAPGNRARVQAHLRRLGWIGEDEQLLALTVAGEGNMNVTLRASLGRRSMILKQSRPYVAKYPEIPAPVERLDVEAAFYRAIAASPQLRRCTPEVLGEDRANHLLCLQDLGEAGDFSFLYQRHGSPGADGSAADSALPARITRLANWLGELHNLAVGGLDFPANAAMRALNHAHIFEIPFDPDNGVAVSPELERQRRAFAADAALRAEAARLGRLYLGAERCPAAPVLLHGDFYPGSWLALPADGVAVIDPEFAFVGPAEFDVGVFTVHLIMGGFDEAAVAEALLSYTPPAGFDQALTRRFAAIEVIRRLLGVAQLPLRADEATRAGWLAWAREVLGT